MRAHEWFDLLDEDFDQAVFRQTPEQNRFDQQVGNDLIVDGDMFEMIGMSRLRAFRKARHRSSLVSILLVKTERDLPAYATAYSESQLTERSAEGSGGLGAFPVSWIGEQR